MPLYRIVFREHGGYQVACRVRAIVDQPTLLALAVEQVWGVGAYWTWLPGSDTDGRVYAQTGDAPAPGEDRALTGVMTVQITPAPRRPPP